MGPRHLNFVLCAKNKIWCEIAFFSDRTLAQRQEVDRYKEECALKKGFHVLRVHGPDFYLDKNNIVENVLKVISQLRKIKKPKLVKVYRNITWY